jgi:hypothetical protein
LFSYPAFADTFLALGRVNSPSRLHWLLDLPQARAIAGGANNLGQIFTRSFHRNQSSKTKNFSSPYATVAAGRNRATQNPFGSDDGQYFYGETDFGFPEFNRFRHTIHPAI